MEEIKIERPYDILMLKEKMEISIHLYDIWQKMFPQLEGGIYDTPLIADADLEVRVMTIIDGKIHESCEIPKEDAEAVINEFNRTQDKYRGEVCSQEGLYRFRVYKK